MHYALIRTLVTLIFCLPSMALAATTAQTIHAEWTAYSAPSGYTVTGFNLYQEGSRVCQATGSSATSIDCTVSLEADTVNFTLTAAFSNGTESPQSPTFAFTRSSSSAGGGAGSTSSTIHAEWTAYSAPAGYSVKGFNLYQEDKLACQVQSSSAKSMDCAVSLSADTTEFTLAAAFSDGTESPHSSPFSYTRPTTSTGTSSSTGSGSTTTPTTPPKAVISSSTAAGPAPLTVTFNGASSTAASGSTISSYAWNFGDGSSAAGANTSHAFTSAGTYTATLTITDSKGITGSTTTPIVVTAATVSNKTPTAKITATPVTGTAPLSVTFDASGSTDSDGTIASYIWTFGDGSTASGKTASHTYTTAATISASLKVTDNLGASSTTSTTITVNKAQQTAGINIEVGEIEVSSNWVHVPLNSKFTSPIVVAGPPRFNNSDPCVIYIRNVNTTGFDIKLAEWNYEDGVHPAETISYVVLEKGRTTLPDGSVVEAGSFTGSTNFTTINFSKSFTKTPVVLTTMASMNETDTVSGRIKDIGVTGFAYYFKEQMANRNKHANETVNYIAWEPGKGTVGSVQYEIAITANAVTHNWYTHSFQGAFNQAPMILADMQTTNGGDTCALRMQKVANSNFQVKVEEEASKDPKANHGAETVGYFSVTQVDAK